MAKKITKLTKNAAFYLGKCIWWPLVKDFMPNHHPPSDHHPRALIPKTIGKRKRESFKDQRWAWEESVRAKKRDGDAERERDVSASTPSSVTKRKRDCAWGCTRGTSTDTTWENLQIEKHKSGRRSLRSPDWFLCFSICRFSQVVSIARAQPHAQSLFLFPIVFGINIFDICEDIGSAGIKWLSRKLSFSTTFPSQKKVHKRLPFGKLVVTGHFSDYFTSSFKSETFMHLSCSLLISGIHFYSHSLRKQSAWMSQVLFINVVDRLTFPRSKPHLSCQKCPKTVFSSKEDVPMITLWKKESIPTRIAWGMAEKRVPRLLRAIGPP